MHAINWYGYNDTLAIAGNLVLAGVTGSGKSVLMDLVQLVLVGADRAMFNRSATGTKSDRTLKSYVLCDTKREENGQPQYVRDKGAITYAALEFTWPDNQRVETWGLRIEFRNPAENQGRVTPFYCPAALERQDFLDSTRRPLELAAFRNFIEKQKEGHTFETQEQYLRDMANARHLNFNRGVLTSLLPSAMSFTNLKSFDEFCRRFILPGDKLNVTDVVDSYKNFQAYERDLRDLRDQLDRLNLITTHFTQHQNAERDRVVCRWLAAETSRVNNIALVKETETRLVKLKKEYDQEAARIVELDERIQKRREELKQLQAIISQTSEGQLYLFLRSRNTELVRHIDQLRLVGSRLDTALRQRVQNAKTWCKEVDGAPVAGDMDITPLENAIRELEACEASGSEDALNALAIVVEQIKISLSGAVRPLRGRLEELREELGCLRDEVNALQLGHLPFPTRLLSAVNDALPPEGRNPAAQSLCKLCEVVDEKWRPAIEVAFTRKFAVVVNESHYEKALKIYHTLKADSPSESLINPRKAKTRPVKPGSLAEKIRAEHPIAKAIISQLFGDLMCVENPEDLAQHDRAILPDGFMSAGAFVERRRHYDNLPFVGLAGLQKQLEVKRMRLAQLEAEERQLRPRVEETDRISRRATELIPDHNSLKRDLFEAANLPKLEHELKQNIEKLNHIDRASFEEKEREWAARDKECQQWEVELRPLLASQNRGKIEDSERQLKSLRQELESTTRAFERVQQETGDISIHAARLNDLRKTVITEFPALDVAARRFDKMESEARVEGVAAWERVVADRRELAMVYRKYEELAPENPQNAPWEKLRLQIAGANIPEYQGKSEAARKQWENLFRNNVLARLDRALRDVRDHVYLLNNQLKSPIGNDRYEIHATPSPDFKLYRELISLNAQFREDDLFFSSVNGDMRAALDYFLKTLVEQPDSLESVRLLDYRHYFDYDLLVWDARDAQAKPVSVDRQSGKFSGGENQSPYFVAILASYLRAYNRHETRWREPALAVVPIDEAFSKLSPERIEDCVRALKQLDLQGVLSMSAGNIPFAFSQCDQLIIVSKHEERQGSRTRIRNVPVSILRDTEEGRQWMEQHA
jgi:DNA repair exonuclease SbcCD ATPase subunit